MLNHISTIMKSLMLFLMFALFASGCKEPVDWEYFDNATNVNKIATVITVGVEDGYAGDCPGAGIDADRMHKLLSNYASSAIAFKDKSAYKSEVVEALRKGVQSELCIFYYSGHGGSTTAWSDKTETDGKDEYLCLYDRELMDNEIWNIISEAKGRVVLIIDACHSQTMFRSPVNFAKQRRKLRATTSVSGNCSILCWSGCPDSSYSYGSASGGKFTNTLLEYFNANLTYDELWKKMESDKSLQQYEMIQRTIIGTDFNDTLVFQ